MIFYLYFFISFFLVFFPLVYAAIDLRGKALFFFFEDDYKPPLTLYVIALYLEPGHWLVLLAA